MSGMVKAPEIISRAAEIVGGDRREAYGSLVESFQDIAHLWNGHLREKLSGSITAEDVAVLMILLKTVRSKSEKFNVDDYVDIAGYAGCAAEIGENERDNR